MSQDYFGEPGPSKQKQAETPSTPALKWQRPSYMTVGSGSTSEHADRLQAMLEVDSGYGSMADGASISGNRWDPDNLSDTPTGAFSPLQPGASPPHTEQDRRAVQSHIHQLHYNHNRTALARAISRVTDSLRRLQDYNREWPAHYPSVPAPAAVQSPPRNQQHSDARPGLVHTQTSREDQSDRFQKRPKAIRRADTSIGESQSQPESSSAGTQRTAPEPRLVTPQLARDFSVLKIDLKMDGMAQADIMHSLRKDAKALAQLLDGQISKSLRHLGALRERIEDTSSKVLVTGDLNAGKSTFCNALLRRKVLPEDEQPCTSIFCEVLDVRENGGLEEVHAIPVNSKYDRKDERTYSVYPLDKLEQIVMDNERYAQCKVYIKDIRSVDESLLNNGVLDIALIDAPGLNNDSLKTTAVFARQEEIDVVVFVVSAANHFTLSAREFIYDAAREKAFMFMVVNGFDNIKNKERCQEQVLRQVAHLSPATFKESSELVHFVSSNAVPVAPVGGGGAPGGSSNSGSASASSSGSPSDPHGNDSDNDDDSDEKHSPDEPKGKGKEKINAQRRDFAALESSLRRFILEKRARSKLAPAKHYLLNVLSDLNSLASVNRDVAQAELERVARELDELKPLLEQSAKSRSEAGDELDRATEDAASDVYNTTRDTINACIGNLSRADLTSQVSYPGAWEAYNYAYDIQNAMLADLNVCVGTCEDHARAQTDSGVNMVKQLGLLHLGDAYSDSGLNFQPDRMFKRKKDALARMVDIDIEVWDFFDIPGLWERQEKVVGGSMAVTVAGVLGGRMLGGLGWVDGALGAVRVLGQQGTRRLIVPGILLGVILAATWALSAIPYTLPRRLSTKLSARLAELDFTHTNALRLSAECRKALKLPADNLRIGLQREVEGLRRSQDEKAEVRIESETARKWFGNLVRESEEVANGVRSVDLEGAGTADALA